MSRDVDGLIIEATCFKPFSWIAPEFRVSSPRMTSDFGLEVMSSIGDVREGASFVT